MNRCINFRRYLRTLIDDEKQVQQGAKIIKTLLEAQLPRLTNISKLMAGKSDRGYKPVPVYEEDRPKKTYAAALPIRCGICDWRSDRNGALQGAENILNHKQPAGIVSHQRLN